MNAIQPSFFQWRKKISAALAMDASRVHLSFTAPNGRSYSIEPEELQTPQPGTYTAKVSNGNGGEQEISADFEVNPERPLRRSPEDAFISRYERMADDLEHARQVSENRARAAEAEKLAALDTVTAQQRRIHELELQVEELKQQNEGMLDNESVSMLVELVNMWTGTADLREVLGSLLRAIEEDPLVMERVVKRVPPDAMVLLMRAVTEADAPEA
jgi:hypothetical protein